MLYLLDTCVVSDGAKANKFPNLTAWLGTIPLTDCAISVLTLGEIRSGVELLSPSHPKRSLLSTWLTQTLATDFADRILTVDTQVADAWGRLQAASAGRNRKLQVIDGLLLATAEVHGLTFVTRNEKDCKHTGVPLLAPY